MCGAAEPLHVALNEAADALADVAAAFVEIPEDDALRFAHLGRRAWLVQKRIVAAHQFAMTVPRKAQKPCPQPRAKKHKLTLSDQLADLRELGHDVHQLGAKFRCAQCLKGFAKS
jgi:hypothetical protein